MHIAFKTLDAEITGEVLEHLRSWIGKTEQREELVSPGPVQALSAALDRADPLPKEGDPVPRLWHWLNFLPYFPHSDLDQDGHVQRGGFLPPVPLPRRMWASGKLEWLTANNLCIGDMATRISKITSVEHRRGKSGDLIFVGVNHEIRNSRGLSSREDQTIVYKPAPQPNDPSPSPVFAEAEEDWNRSLIPDEILLFRYSALTYNSHRIHYDRQYAVEVEKYPGLVVHGPLLATLLADLMRREMPGAHLSKFEFRAIRPTFAGEKINLSGALDKSDNTVKLWASDAASAMLMSASASFI